MHRGFTLSVTEQFETTYQVHNDLHLNIDFLQNNESLLMVRNENTDSDQAAVETFFSKQRRAVYVQKYGRDIEAPKSRLSFMASIVANTVLLFPKVRSLCKAYKVHSYIEPIRHILI